MVSERPTEAMKAKGQASNIMNAAMSRRMGNSVTVINAICEIEKKQKDQLFSILLQFLFVKGRLQPTEWIHDWSDLLQDGYVSNFIAVQVAKLEL